MLLIVNRTDHTPYYIPMSTLHCMYTPWQLLVIVCPMHCGPSGPIGVGLAWHQKGWSSVMCG